MSSIWLTVNRSCNIRCKWCYARDTNYLAKNDMSIENAKKAIDIAKDAGITNVVILGGEPTVYPHLMNVLNYCYERELKTILITNGINLADSTYLNKLVECHVSKIAISLKAPSEESYLELTGKDAFKTVLKAIENLRGTDIYFVVSTVISSSNIDTFVSGIEAAKNVGAEHFSISFCYNCDMGDGSKIEYLKNNNPYLIANRFYSQYDKMMKVVKGCKISINQNLPFCVWDDNALTRMINDGVLSFGCQLLKNPGIIFDTDLALIPCNAMYKLRYGFYGKDFNDFNSLTIFRGKEEVKSMYTKLRRLPSNECRNCKWVHNCVGGCVCNWTNYSFLELKGMRKL